MGEEGEIEEKSKRANKRSPSSLSHACLPFFPTLEYKGKEEEEKYVPTPLYHHFTHPSSHIPLHHHFTSLHPTSHIPHPTSHIPHPSSSHTSHTFLIIPHIPHPSFHILHPTLLIPSIPHPTSVPHHPALSRIIPHRPAPSASSRIASTHPPSNSTSLYTNSLCKGMWRAE
jgi:hypothetical protein